MLAAADKFFTHFTTVKRTVIPSRSLRIPEVIVTFSLVFGVLVWHIFYKLNFLVDVPLRLNLHASWVVTQTNWWDCWRYDGTCRYDLPEPKGVSYCSQPQVLDHWNTTLKKHETRSRVIDCQQFNVDTDIQQQSSGLWITTMVRELNEETVLGGWYQVPHHRIPPYFMVGAEQMVALQGTFPPGLGPSSLGGMQGFLRYRNGTEARIRCAAEGDWKDCPHVPAAEYWPSHYPHVCGFDTSPDYTYNATGCIQEVTGGLVCHLKELLQAAGVDLDAHREDESSLRARGVTLNVKVTVTNSDLHDYWAWPFGPKPKYIIEAAETSDKWILLYMRYTEDKNNKTLRRRHDHYGIDLKLSPETSWRMLSWSNLIGVLVISIGLLKYANMFVTSVLVYVYALLGHSHVSLLYQYNAHSIAAQEHEMVDLADHHDVRKRHQHAEEAYLQQLFKDRVQECTPSVSSRSGYWRPG